MATTRAQSLKDGDETAALRADIAGTRDEMSRTVDAIEGRLSPAHFKKQAADVKEAVLEQFQEAKVQMKDEILSEVRQAKLAVRDATVGRVENMIHDVRDGVAGAGMSVFDTIRANPIPAAMVAVGVSWLFMRGSRSETGYARGQGSRVRERVEEGTRRLASGAENVAEDVREKAQSIAAEARAATTHIVEDVRAVGERIGQRAERDLRRTERTFDRTMRDNPLAVGALSLAVGAAIGLALPHTAKEDEWMGKPKERLLERGKNVAEGALQQVEEKVEQLASSRKDEREGELGSERSNADLTPQHI